MTSVDSAADRLNTALAGRYVIERELGRGGMATVYLAHDLRHDRHVALKLVHPELGAVLGAERFLTEIRVTASLQHPHILPLFDSGKAEALGEGMLYYVMPYVEGESLRERLTRDGPLRIEEAVRIAMAVADALEYAHRRGVVHRDLKPENILLHGSPPQRGTSEVSHAVVADFGLALAVSSAGGERLTQTGLSLGTPQYMSPEQATGDRRVDARTDIYSLGAVLYEMLAGEPPHTGPTVQAVFAKLLTDRPRPLRLARDTVPVYLEAAADRALAKLPADRFGTAREFADALAQRGGEAQSASGSAALAHVSHMSGHAEHIQPPPSRSRWSRAARWFPWAVAVFGAGAAPALWSTRRHVPDAVTARFAVPLPDDERLTDRSDGVYFALSPDGRRVVYVGRAGLTTRLFVRPLDQLTPRVLGGTEGAKCAAISPDGRWVAFVSGTTLRKLPIDGGPAVDLAEVTQADLPSLAWPTDSMLIIGGTGDHTGLSAVSTNGGTIRELTRPDSKETQHVLPQAVPGGKLVLFTVWGPSDSRDDYIAIVSLATQKVTITPLVGAAAIGIVDGHLLYVRTDGVVMSAPFDERTLRVTGEAISVFEGVKPGAWPGTPMVAANGTMAYVGGGVRSRIVMADAHGSRTVIDEPRAYAHPRLSPDGRRLAVQIESATGTAIWVYDIPTKTMSRLTPELYNVRPEWSPDGTHVLLWSLMNGRRGLGWLPADGSGAIEPLVLGSDVEGVLSPDGKTLLYRSDDGRGHMEVGAQSLVGAKARTPLIADGARNLGPRLSPDGKWFAYASDQSGQFEVFVRPFPGPGGREQVSVDGGSEPIWSRDGRHLFYRQGTQFMSATLAPGPTPTVTSRQSVLEGDYLADVEHADYDVTPDGTGIVALAPVEAMQLTVVVNWTQELRRRFAAGGR